LDKSFFPRLGHYAKLLLEEGSHPEDIKFAVRKVIEGGHSPYLLRSFVIARVGPRGTAPRDEAYDQAVSDFPDYSGR
jgi:hypothetical protein